MMKNIKGLSGAIYNTEYAMICQRVPNERHILPHLQNAWIGTYTDYILAEQKVENIKNK